MTERRADAATCSGSEEGCITCGDAAVSVTVVALDPSGDARCVDASGRVEIVAVDLVGLVEPGDHLLVHAKVALARLGPEVPSPRGARP